MASIKRTCYSDKIPLENRLDISDIKKLTTFCSHCTCQFEARSAVPEPVVSSQPSSFISFLGEVLIFKISLLYAFYYQNGILIS